MADDHQPLDPAVIAWNPPSALDEDSHAAWAELVSEIPADRLTKANIPLVAAAARLTALLRRTRSVPDVDSSSALVDLLYFLGCTPASRGLAPGFKGYEIREPGEAS